MVFSGWGFCHEGYTFDSPHGRSLRVRLPFFYGAAFTTFVLSTSSSHMIAARIVPCSLILKTIHQFHIEGRNIWDVDCCIKTCTSRYLHACPLTWKILSFPTHHFCNRLPSGKDVVLDCEFSESSWFSFYSSNRYPDVTIRSREKSFNLSSASFSSWLVFVMNNNQIFNGCSSVGRVLSSITMRISQFE